MWVWVLACCLLPIPSSFHDGGVSSSLVTEVSLLHTYCSAGGYGTGAACMAQRLSARVWHGRICHNIL